MELHDSSKQQTLVVNLIYLRHLRVWRARRPGLDRLALLRKSCARKVASGRQVICVVSGVRRPGSVRRGEMKPDRRRIPDTTPWTKPVGLAYGYWYLACVKGCRHGAHVRWRAEVGLSVRREGIRQGVMRQRALRASREGSAAHVCCHHGLVICVVVGWGS
jgi:hypothetical protein